MPVEFEDITVQWGSRPDALDMQMARWRQAVFQDLIITGDHRFMYFLYDPIADETSGTSGGRKGPPSIVLFDTNARKFVREIALPLREQQEGVLKFFWLIDDLPTGCASMVIVTEQYNYSQRKLGFWQVRLSPDGLNLAGQPQLLFGPVPVGEDYIVNNREDVAEIVLMSGPGLTVWRIDARLPNQQPVDSFAVSGGDMSRYYDAFMWSGIVYLLSQRPYDAMFDFSCVSMLDLRARGSPLLVQPLMADPMRGFPPNRKQAGLAMYMGRVYLCGGESQQSDGSWFRYQDVWSFEVGTFTWTQHQCTVPLPLIEPRLKDATGGKLYIWGDCDIPQGCVAPPTHSHMIRMSGATQEPPPPYHVAANTMGGMPPAYTPQDPHYPSAPPTGQQSGFGGPSAAGFGGGGGGGYPAYPQQFQSKGGQAYNASAQKHDTHHHDHHRKKSCEVM